MNITKIALFLSAPPAPFFGVSFPLMSWSASTLSLHINRTASKQHNTAQRECNSIQIYKVFPRSSVESESERPIDETRPGILIGPLNDMTTWSIVRAHSWINLNENCPRFASSKVMKRVKMKSTRCGKTTDRKEASHVMWYDVEFGVKTPNCQLDDVICCCLPQSL